MGKQAMGIYASNYQVRMDTMAHVLHYPQKPLCTTRAMEFLKFRELPSGVNVVVGIMIYTGYNQEDSVILNRGSLKRGFMRGYYYTVYKDEEHRNVASGREERFSKARHENTKGYKNTSYNAIQENGIPIKNAVVQENDVVIGKVVNLRSDPHVRVARTRHVGRPWWRQRRPPP